MSLVSKLPANIGHWFSDKLSDNVWTLVVDWSDFQLLTQDTQVFAD